MIKLTPALLSLLAAADGSKDGGLIRPLILRPSLAAKAAAKLIDAKLVREVRARADLPVWREDGEGGRFSLMILKAGRAAARAASGHGGEEMPANVPRAASTSQQPPTTPTIGRPGSKRALVVGLLQRSDGATMQDLMAATGWLPHTTRAALTGLRKSGLSIVRRRDAETQGSVYRLAPVQAEAA